MINIKNTHIPTSLSIKKGIGSINEISTSKIINKIETKKNRYENTNRVYEWGSNPHS